jgi:hypothetical protein
LLDLRKQLFLAPAFAVAANMAHRGRDDLHARRQVRQRSGKGLYLNRGRIGGIETNVKQPPEYSHRHLGRRKVHARRLGNYFLGRLLDPVCRAALWIS